jgi:protein-disulfide isomerase
MALHQLRDPGPPGNSKNIATAHRRNSLKNRYAVLTAALLLTFTASIAHSQAPAAAQAPAAPTPKVRVPPASLTAPPAPATAPATPPADPFPPTNPKYFTATTPTLETVNAFLHQVWGFDSGRIYRVMAIQTTPAPGVAKVTIFVTSKAPDAKMQAATFYVTPDGKHAIGEASGIVPFGATPFAPARDILKARADGAYRGADSKDLQLVEFADLQCPHCKDAQAIMDNIVHDFPKARVVFQLFPLVEIHPSAFKAAAYGICAQKVSNDAFFKYAAGVFDTQEGLAPATEDTILKAAAKRAGLDSDAIAACSETQATKDVVKADIKLGEDIGVDQTPLLSVNGRLVPLGNVNYDALKQVIQFQAKLDGVDSGATPETLAPKPPPPTLSDLPK